MVKDHVDHGASHTTMVMSASRAGEELEVHKFRRSGVGSLVLTPVALILLGVFDDLARHY